MVKRTGPSNVHLRKLIQTLRKKSKENDAPIWRYTSELLSKPRRDRVEVNLSKIDRYSSEGDVVLVPGKVLGCGKITKKIKIAAWRFSYTALQKIKDSGSEIISIEDLSKENPKGSNIKIII